jgi:hypothetical protein
MGSPMTVASQEVGIFLFFASGWHGTRSSVLSSELNHLESLTTSHCGFSFPQGPADYIKTMEVDIKFEAASDMR